MDLNLFTVSGKLRYTNIVRLCNVIFLLIELEFATKPTTNAKKLINVRIFIKNRK